VSGSEVVVGPLQPPSQSAAEDDGDGDGGPGSGFGSGFVGIIDTGQVSNGELIDEAVASGGDSTLWTDGEDEEEEPSTQEGKEP
jgi:hypothetical protein